jgi:hypothetical protein
MNSALIGINRILKSLHRVKLSSEQRGLRNKVGKKSYENRDLLKTYGVASTNMAQLRLEHAGKLTAIVQDNASIHCSLLTQQQWELSSAARQLIFFLPPYSPLQEPY